MILRFILLTALYVLGTWYAEAFIVGAGQVTLFWPAAGVAYAAVLHYGWRVWPFIPMGVLIAHLAFAGVPLSFLPFSMLSNLLGALAGAWVAGNAGGQLKISNGLAMLRGALLMVLVSALIGTAGLVFAGMVSRMEIGPAFLRWTLGDLLGLLCISPSMLLLLAPATDHPDMPGNESYSGIDEKMVWILSLLVSYGLVYWSGMETSAYALGMVAAPLIVLLWSALRFQPIWTTIGTSVTVFFMTSLTGLGLAGFQQPEGWRESALLLGFMCLVAAVPLLLLASINEQRISARKLLRRATTSAAAQRAELERVVAERTLELNAANLKLETASQTDPLTGLRNRRYLANQIPADLSFYDREHMRTGRDDHALLFALVDIDNFKRINDRHGHKAGDRVLQQFADVMSRLVRVGDYVVRWGGEEFLLIFRPMPREHVPVVGERIRRCVAEHRFTYGADEALSVTCSVGMAEYPLFRDSRQQLGWEAMIELADAALYWVKANGRDGWATFRPTPSTDLSTLLPRLQHGAQELIDEGQLALVHGAADLGAAVAPIPP